MKLDAIQHLARLLTEQGKVVDFKDNSVFGLTTQANNIDNVNQIAKIIAGKVNNDLGMIRNMYIPFVTYFKDIVEEYIKQRGSIDSIKDYSIIEMDRPAIYDAFKAKGRFDNDLINTPLPVSSVTVKIPEGIKIRDMLKTGIPSYDIEMAIMAARYTDEDLLNIWEKFFYNISQDNAAVTDLSRNTQKYINDIVIVYALILNMIDNMPDTVTMDADAFKRVMYAYRDKIQFYLKETDRSYTNAIEQDRLIIKLDPKSVMVNGTVYKKFLSEAENTPEILFGMLVSDKITMASYYLNDIILRKQEYIMNWDAKAKRTAIAAGLEEYKHYILAYEMVIRKIMGNLETDVKIPNDIKTNITKTTLEVVDEFKAEFKTADIATLRDVFEVSRIITMKIMLSNTNAYRITNYINEYKRINPDITIQNAATFSSVDLILDYLLEQVEVRGTK